MEQGKITDNQLAALANPSSLSVDELSLAVSEMKDPVKVMGLLKDKFDDDSEKQIVRIISYDVFTPEKLMTMLDKDKLEELEEEFEQHPDGIELINFVWLMKNALKVDKTEEYGLIYGLCRLFSDIDINGDLHMEWTEFTQYIIDTVMKNSTNNDYLQMLKEKKKLDKNLAGGKNVLGEKKMTLLDLSNFSIFKRYYLSTKSNKIIYQKFIKKGIFCK